MHGPTLTSAAVALGDKNEKSIVITETTFWHAFCRLEIPEGAQQGVAHGVAQGTAHGVEHGTAHGVAHGVVQGVAQGAGQHLWHHANAVLLKHRNKKHTINKFFFIKLLFQFIVVI